MILKYSLFSFVLIFFFSNDLSAQVLRVSPFENIEKKHVAVRHVPTWKFRRIGIQALAYQKDSSSLEFFAIPIVFYSPDTKLGGGGGGIVTWQSENALYPNSVTFSAAYTQRRQILAWFPFQYYAPNTAWQAYGEVGYFKYIFDYFGIGNEAAVSGRETYSAKFPRVRLTALKQVKNRQFAGLRYAFDDYRIFEKDSTANGKLLNSRVLGENGGRISGFGAVWLTDTRDQRFYSRKGWIVEYLAYIEGQYTGSDFNYQQFGIQASHFIALDKKWTLGLNGIGIATFGDIPFFNMPLLGGTKRLRGYREGRFRDRHLLLAQAEIRRPLFWRIGMTSWVGTGSVFGTEGEDFTLRPNFGLGLRFALDPKQNLNVRLDYGFGSKGNSGFYLTIGEAF